MQETAMPYTDKNPYSLTFGLEPVQLIARYRESDQILKSFLSDTPPQRIFLNSGVRGCGKTIFMTSVSKKLSEHSEWITVELNSIRDLLLQLASKLSSKAPLARIFQTAGIDLSFFGIGLKVKNSVPITDIETALEKMLASLKKHGKRLLVTIDEVSNTKRMREFAAAFQIFFEKRPACISSYDRPL